jgi:formylglycine-generating enzyme required for sulfatase activity
VNGYALKAPVEFRDTLKDGGQGPEMAVIPAGRFQMGSPITESGRSDDESPHEVEAAAFTIGKYEVTVEQFKQFVQMKGYPMGTELENSCNWRNPGFPQIDEHPVVCVSWDDAMAYIEWLSAQTGQHYRLPTKGEWEYAARAGTRTAYYWSDSRNKGCAYANVADQTARKQFPKWVVLDCQDGYIFTAPVGHYLANAFGLHDMLSNVWEWTCSKYDKDYSGAEQRCVSDMGQAPRVLRGGSWNFDPQRVRTAARDWLYPPDRRLFDGFRLARTFSP